MSATTWTAAEREAIVNLSDADGSVGVWAAQRPVIREMRKRPAAVEVRSGEGWAEFVIPADQWNVARGFKRTVRPMSEAQRIALSKAREGRG